MKSQGNYIEIGGFWDDAKDFLSTAGKATVDVAKGVHESEVRQKIAEEQAEAARARQDSTFARALPFLVLGGVVLGGIVLLRR